MTVVVRSGIAAGERRVIDYPESREVTRQFPAPVFDHTSDELELRIELLTWHMPRSQVAWDRFRLLSAVCLFAKDREMLDAFDAENRAVLGVGP